MRITKLEVAGTALGAVIEPHCHLVARCRYYTSPPKKPDVLFVYNRATKTSS